MVGYFLGIGAPAADILDAILILFDSDPDTKITEVVQKVEEYENVIQLPFFTR